MQFDSHGDGLEPTVRRPRISFVFALAFTLTLALILVLTLALETKDVEANDESSRLDGRPEQRTATRHDDVRRGRNRSCGQGVPRRFDQVIEERRKGLQESRRLEFGSQGVDDGRSFGDGLGWPRLGDGVRTRLEAPQNPSVLVTEPSLDRSRRGSVAHG